MLILTVWFFPYQIYLLKHIIFPLLYFLMVNAFTIENNLLKQFCKFKDCRITEQSAIEFKPKKQKKSPLGKLRAALNAKCCKVPVYKVNRHC